MSTGLGTVDAEEDMASFGANETMTQRLLRRRYDELLVERKTTGIDG
jgi:hypothetical protein